LSNQGKAGIYQIQVQGAWSLVSFQVLDIDVEKTELDERVKFQLNIHM